MDKLTCFTNNNSDYQSIQQFVHFFVIRTSSNSTFQLQKLIYSGPTILRKLTHFHQDKYLRINVITYRECSLANVSTSLSPQDGEMSSERYTRRMTYSLRATRGMKYRALKSRQTILVDLFRAADSAPHSHSGISNCITVYLRHPKSVVPRFY